MEIDQPLRLVSTKPSPNQLSSTFALPSSRSPAMGRTSTTLGSQRHRADAPVQPGDPPPVLLRPDGTAIPFSTDRTDPPLGVSRIAQRHNHTLTPGAVVLLHTNGLLERRDHLQPRKDAPGQCANINSAPESLRKVLLDRHLNRSLPVRFGVDMQR
jgi:hypothetical protein